MCRIPSHLSITLNTLIQSLPIDIFHVHLIDASNIHYYFFQIVKDRQPTHTSVALTGSIANGQYSIRSLEPNQIFSIGAPFGSEMLVSAEALTIIAIGGGRRDRTDDPLLAKQVLSQLSYAPIHTEFIITLDDDPRGCRQSWWVWLDSNQRPPPYQDGALTD